jgi:hypothetical protein
MALDNLGFIMDETKDRIYPMISMNDLYVKFKDSLWDGLCMHTEEKYSAPYKTHQLYFGE